MIHLKQHNYPIIKGCAVDISPAFPETDRQQISSIIFRVLSQKTTIIYPGERIYTQVGKWYKDIMKEVNELPVGLYAILINDVYSIIECKEENGIKKIHGIDCVLTVVVSYSNVDNGFISVGTDNAGNTVMQYNDLKATYTTLTNGMPLFYKTIAFLLFYFLIEVKKITLTPVQSTGKLLGCKYSSDLENEVTVFDIKL